jgi:hypothetical protein
MNRATRLGVVTTVMTLLGAAWLILTATRNDLVVGGALLAVSATALLSILVLSVRALRRAATLRAREDR